MIEKRTIPYWEIDEYSERIKRNLTAIIKEANENLKKAPKVKRKNYSWWRYEELVPPVISPEKPHFTF